MLDRKKQRAERMKVLAFQEDLFSKCTSCEKRNEASVAPCKGCPIFHAQNQIEQALENIKKFGFECYQVKGFPAYYVDRDGNLYSRVNRGNPKLMTKNLRKRNFKKTAGNMTIYLTGGKQRMLHHLIYEAVYGDMPKGKILIRKNGDVADSRLSNLVLSTCSERNEKSFRKRAAITKVRPFFDEIVELKKEMTWAQLSEKYGVSIWALCRHINKYQQQKEAKECQEQS